MDSLYDLSDLSNYTFKVVMEATTTEETAIEWCMKEGLLRDNMTCSICMCPMSLQRDRLRWRCRREGCHDSEIGLRSGSLFKKTTQPISQLVRVLFYWATMKTCRSVVEDLEVSNATAVKWFKFCRKKCSEEMRSCTVKIGGYGSVVEIDETSLKKKSKYGRGTQHEDRWLFGGVDRSTKKWFGVLTGTDRTKETLSRHIANHIAEGSLIVSDKFPSYVSTNERHTIANTLD
ncbi:hypothetical protein AeRB84_021510 [Aphanomyces euteiches]|nr:hypothetical protein AeRB84_021510 [Aphanomyces euteiches]